MTYQEIFSSLSKLESAFYYMNDRYDHMNPTLEEIHDKINFCLISWHEYTGCTNDTNDTREV